MQGDGLCRGNWIEGTEGNEYLLLRGRFRGIPAPFPPYLKAYSLADAGRPDSSFISSLTVMIRLTR